MREVMARSRLGEARVEKTEPVSSRLKIEPNLPSRLKAERGVKFLKVVRVILIALLVLFTCCVIAFLIFFISLSRTLPAPNNVVRREGFSTKIYDRNGVLLYDIHGDERREPVKLADASPYFLQATVAIEDKDFYKHHGFDLLTILRIPYYYVTQGRLVGGSTLTQQLTKNVLLTNERSLIRKAKELILSMQIENQYTKDQILEMYINESPYGGNVYSAQVGAMTFFNKPLRDLSVAESAVLAGLPQSPHRYNPFSGRTDDAGHFLWQERAVGVLRRMREDAYINEFEYSAAISELGEMVFVRQPTDIKAPHFVFYIEQQLVDMYGEEMIQGGGLQVTTTLDWSVQEAAELIVAEEIEKVMPLNITNGAATVLDPQTGEVLALVGSKSYFATDIGGQFDVVTQGLRQPGSSIKPLVYLAYLMRGGRETSLFVDVPTTFQANAQIPAYTPQNYDGKFRGPVDLRHSLANSYNVPAVKAMAYVGVPSFLEFANEAGLSTLAPTPRNLQNLGLALALGGGEVRMLEMSGAYSAFATGGRKVEPLTILEVKDHQGNTLYQANPTLGEQVFGENETFIINNILADNSARSAAFGANSQLNVNTGVAVKTGTTNSMRDNWTIGWSESFLVHVWVGNNDNSPMKNVASGITGASPIWRRIVDHLIEQGYETPEWEMPNGVVLETVDAVSGYRPHDEFPTKTAYFVRGTLASTPDPIHQKIRVCRGENKLATDARIASGDYEERVVIHLLEDDPVSEDGINRFQLGINAWIAGAGDDRYRVPTEYCGDTGDVAVRIMDLENEHSYEQSKIKFRVIADSGDGVEWVEVRVNGEAKQKFEGREREVELDLGKGRFEIVALARSRGGKEAKSNTYKIGAGGVSWKEEEKKPEPTPTPTPTPTPEPEDTGSEG